MIQRHDDAIRAYSRFLRLTPGDADTWYRLGCLLDLVGDGPHVLEVLEILRASDPTRADDFHRKHVAGRP